MGKSDLRAHVLDRRRAMSPSERNNAAAALAAHVTALPVAASARRIACYLSMAAEPGTSPIIETLLARGVEVLVPVVADDAVLDWVVYAADAELVQTAMGVNEPDGPRLGADSIADVDLVIVPALAVDHRGARLGRGEGYYDRALTRTTAPTAALVFDGEIIESVSAEPHDVPVSMAIAPSGVFRVLRD